MQVWGGETPDGEKGEQGRGEGESIMDRGRDRESKREMMKARYYRDKK